MEPRWLENYELGVPREFTDADGTLNTMFSDTVAKYPESRSAIFYGRNFTFAEMGDMTARMTAKLRGLGVENGDRVAIILANLPHYIPAHFGVLGAGATVVPNNPLYTDKELEFQLKDSGAKVVIALDLLLPRLLRIWDNTDLEHCIVCRVNDFLPGLMKYLYPIKAKLEGHKRKVPSDSRFSLFTSCIATADPAEGVAAEVSSSDLAMLLYTGGTTGRSKGAMLTHSNLYSNTRQVASWLVDLEVGKEVIMAAIPFFHSYGLTTCMHFSVACASPVVLIPKFDTAMVMKEIHKQKATIFPGVPTMYTAINVHPKVDKFDLSSIRACLSGAAPLPVEVQKKFEELTGGRLVEGFGLSEASPVTHANPVYGNRKIGMVGLPIPGTDAAVVDPESRKELGIGEVGELAVRGPQVMQGYWNMPEETAGQLQEGWLFTGDLAQVDEEGYFAIVDRMKDMIISGGYNIYPREVEEVLYEHPSVLECGVIGMPDEYRGEAVKAYVVLKEDFEATEDQLIEHCREGLAKFKVPAKIIFAEDLPKSLIGKILRKEIRKMDEIGAIKPVEKE
ncbi:long-chain fatty acid--CoA ligase [Candidatus Zixiibacteriota bacterium]